MADEKSVPDAEGLASFTDETAAVDDGVERALNNVANLSFAETPDEEVIADETFVDETIVDEFFEQHPPELRV